MFNSNASSADAGGADYIEDVFSTYLYTGNGSTQTITNDIDLDGEGGLVWIKQRNATKNHRFCDTVRGAGYMLASDTTDAQSFSASTLVGFNVDGFDLDGNSSANGSGNTYASWTFRKQAKFFDVVTYTGTGANRTLAHNLGSVPGFIIVKRTDASGAWACFHRSLANTQFLPLNATNAAITNTAVWNSTSPTSTVFTVGTDTDVNASGGTYVAYLFAHDAGGFGLTGTDNVISCGSYTGNGSSSGPVVTLGYEPQWVMIKSVDSAYEWFIADTMRGWTATHPKDDNILRANTSEAETANTEIGLVNSTGFQIMGGGAEINGSGETYIYIAIRRGPMKVPTDGTSVYNAVARTGTGANATVTGGAGVSDAVLVKNRGAAVASLLSSRLTGTGYLVTSTTTEEVAAGTTILQANPWDVMDGVKVGTTSTITNASANTYINYLFDRAPGFFDVVCYTGTGSARTLNHNLAAVPELIIVKRRSGTAGWPIYSAPTGITKLLFLNSTDAEGNDPSNTYWNNTLPTTSVFSLGSNTVPNLSGGTYVAYLFASCPGVSKVGSYTGNGSSQTIDCGFTGGARFVLIKRTDSTGDWYVWDSARGIVAGDDPYLLLNSTAAEVTSTDYVDTAASGFELTATAPAAINASGGTYIFLAIA